MKIAYVSDDIRKGSGYGKIGKAFCRYFRDAGHEVIILGSSGIEKPFIPDVFEGMKIWPIQHYGNMEDYRTIVRQEKPDVILLNADPWAFQRNIFAVDNEIRKVCPIVFYHLWDAPPFPRYNLSTYRSCDAIIAASPFTYQLLKDNSAAFSMPPIYYAPIGIDFEYYKPAFPEDRETFREAFRKEVRHLYNPEFIVGYIGRSAPRKRIADLFRIFDKFSQGKDDKVLLFVHTMIIDEAGDLNFLRTSLFPKTPIVLSDQVGQPDSYIVKYLNLFDISINIARAEGFGMPLLESMACGTPVIASACSGPSGFVTNANGWLVEPAITNVTGGGTTPYINDFYVSDEAVVAALEEAYSNRKLYHQKKAVCRESVKEFNVVNMSKAVLDALRDTVSNFKPCVDYELIRIP